MSVPFTAYQRKLLFFLSVATFFEGYDFFAITQVLPHLAAEHGLSETEKGTILSVVAFGTMASYFVVRLADKLGRKRVLTITIVGYTLATLATALTRGIADFAVCQLVARAFLLGEWAVSIVIAAEEFPAERRGFVIGIVQGASSLGYITCAAIVPLLVQAPLGWRTVYLVGVLPLLGIMIARRDLRETERFARAETPRGGMFHIFTTPYRGRLLLLATIWFLAFIAPHNAVSFFKIHAMGELAMPEPRVGLAIAVASIVALPLVFATGRLIDVIGRKRGALVVFGVSIVGTFFIYLVREPIPMQLALVAGIFGASGYLPILNAYTTELFPTELRADAFAWTGTFLGRISYVISPAIVGVAVDRAGSYASVMPFLAVFTLAALLLVLFALPETTGRELEDTASA